MTYKEMKKRAERAEIWACLFGGALVGVLLVFAFMLGVQAGRKAESGAWSEQLRKAQAQAYDEGAEFGNADGWRECIEENNLYDRYVREGSRDTSGAGA